jgi:hypothetical protein
MNGNAITLVRQNWLNIAEIVRWQLGMKCDESEARNSVNPYITRFKQEFWFEAWDGLLQGYYLRR